MQAQAEQIANQVADAFALVGTFAVEFFLTADQTLLVNEIAPRVHNSGHYSQDACTISQFANHWHAVSGRTLTPVQLRAPYFAMLNILGPADVADPL